jgi:ribosome biogenesis protein BRX1
MAEKQNRTLILCSRGASTQQKTLIKDLVRLLPHSKKEAKVDRKKHFNALNDLADLHSCNNVLYLESRKNTCFLWLGHYPEGPSVKFLVENLHTSDEMRLTGNCLKSSRPVLSFDNSFKTSTHLQLIQQMFMQTLATPNRHPKSMPFIDHLFSFSQAFDKIFFRNFEIAKDGKEVQLVEIGPRFTLTTVKVLKGLVSGETLYKNGSFVMPKKELVMRRADRFEEKMRKKAKREQKRESEDLTIMDVYG